MDDRFVSTLIDLDAYPLDRPDSDALAFVVAEGRRQLDEAALCLLPGFLKPDAVDLMANEAFGFSDVAHRRDMQRTPYGWMDNSGFAPGHPRAARHPHRHRSATRNLLPDQSLIEGLYLWDPLTDFLRRLIGYDALFRSADPNLSLEVSFHVEGDQLAWHYDTNDCVVSLMLSASDDGGFFEYVPYLRSEDDENYDEVARVFAGTSGLVCRPVIEPGCLTLFKGRRSLHHVTPTGPTTRPRVMALLSYDQRPDMVFPKATQDSAMAKVSEHIGSPA